MIKRLAILPFKTTSTNIQFLIPIIQEVLISSISAEATYIVISKDSANISAKGNTDLNSIRKQLNTNYFVTGDLVEKETIISVSINYHNLKNSSSYQTHQTLFHFHPISALCPASVEARKLTHDTSAGGPNVELLLCFPSLYFAD